MKNFKPNQKVVFRNMGLEMNPLGNYPKENEVVTIKALSPLRDCWCVYEYPFAKDGDFQAINERKLFPIEEVFSEQSQEDVERIESEIEKEQLITVTP